MERIERSSKIELTKENEQFILEKLEKMGFRWTRSGKKPTEFTPMQSELWDEDKEWLFINVSDMMIFGGYGLGYENWDVLTEKDFVKEDTCTDKITIDMPIEVLNKMVDCGCPSDVGLSETPKSCNEVKCYDCWMEALNGRNMEL